MRQVCEATLCQDVIDRLYEEFADVGRQHTPKREMLC
jgi:hypothetical protein